jgi:hypothetical protein
MEPQNDRPGRRLSDATHKGFGQGHGFEFGPGAKEAILGGYLKPRYQVIEHLEGGEPVATLDRVLGVGR